MPYTIDSAIEMLQKAREDSPLKGETVLCICLPGVEYVSVETMKLEADDSGAVVTVQAPDALSWMLEHPDHADAALAMQGEGEYEYGHCTVRPAPGDGYTVTGNDRYDTLSEALHAIDAMDEAARKTYKVTAHVGIEHPIGFTLQASSLEEAREAADQPDDALRAVIEEKMAEARVDPGIRGWHNYEVATVTEQP